MNCKHKNIIRIYKDGKRDFYCTAKQKEIAERECKNCMLQLPDIPNGFEKLFGKGFVN